VPPHFTNYATLSVFDGDGTRVACSGHESARSRGASARPATWAPHRTDAVHIDPSVDSSKRGCRNERSLSRLARAKGQPTPGPRVPWREKKIVCPDAARTVAAGVQARKDSRAGGQRGWVPAAVTGRIRNLDISPFPAPHGPGLSGPRVPDATRKREKIAHYLCIRFFSLLLVAPITPSLL
jgi:hypothetical protein